MSRRISSVLTSASLGIVLLLPTLGILIPVAAQAATEVNFHDYLAVTVEDGGATLHIVGNGWRKINFPYVVTPSTVLEFDLFRFSGNVTAMV